MNSRVGDFCPACGARTESVLRDGRLRPTCPDCGHVVYFDPKVAAVAFVTQSERVLLARRARDPARGLWSVPGGFVEAEEDPREAARREMVEETGYTIRIDRLLDVFSGQNGVIVIAYAATITGGTERPGDDVDKLAWFARDELPRLAFDSTVALVGRWREGEL
jgi:8-oxo-dGTP diphosphatase